MEPLVVLSRLLDSARKAGARGAEGLITESSETTMHLVERQISPARSHSEVRLQFRVYTANGRLGIGTVDAPGLDKLEALVDTALEVALTGAEAAPEDPLEGPADRFDLDGRGLGLQDRRRPLLTNADRRDLLRENEAGCAGISSDVHVDQVTYRESAAVRTFSSSRGATAVESSTRYDASATARLGTNGRAITEEVASRQFANVASIPFGAELGRRLQRLDQRCPPPSRPLPILISPPAMAHLLASLAPAFTAESVRSGRSFVSRFLGRPLTNPRLHVIDDPSLPGALGTRSFDDRGVLPGPVVILKEGVAASLYVDLRTARATDSRPTGHEFGGTVGPSNLVMRSGTRSRNAIGMDLGDYLVLDSFHEPHPLDLATGQVESLCDLLVYANNEFHGAMPAVPLRLPLRRLLSAVREVAGDQARYHHVDAATVVLDPLPSLVQ